MKNTIKTLNNVRKLERLKKNVIRKRKEIATLNLSIRKRGEELKNILRSIEETRAKILK